MFLAGAESKPKRHQMKIKCYVVAFFMFLTSVPQLAAQLSHTLVEMDVVRDWVEDPKVRSHGPYVAYIQILSITNEEHIFTNQPNSSQTFDGGKIWSNLLNIQSGVATAKILESPGAEMPATNIFYFECRRPVPAREWLTNEYVQPGSKWFGAFRKDGDKWVLQDFWLYNPKRYFMDSRYCDRLQALFKTPLFDDPKLIEWKKKENEAWKKHLMEVTNQIRNSNSNFLQ